MKTEKLKLDVSHLNRGSLGKYVLNALDAYEEGEAKRRNWKRYVAVRTRKALIEHGPQVTIKRILARPKPTPGFQAMVDSGQAKHTYEWIALLHPREFVVEERETARDRLKLAGVKRVPKAS